MEKVFIVIWIMVLCCIGFGNLMTFIDYAMSRARYSQKVAEMMKIDHEENDFIKVCKPIGAEGKEIHPIEEYPFLRGHLEKTILGDDPSCCVPYTWYNHMSLTLVIINIVSWCNKLING